MVNLKVMHNSASLYIAKLALTQVSFFGVVFQLVIIACDYTVKFLNLFCVKGTVLRVQSFKLNFTGKLSPCDFMSCFQHFCSGFN